jgi:hypothetical protein
MVKDPGVVVCKLQYKLKANFGSVKGFLSLYHVLQ